MRLEARHPSEPIAIKRNQPGGTRCIRCIRPWRGCRDRRRRLLASAPAAAQQQNRISITTGGTGGVYYPLGGGMANDPVEVRAGLAGDRRGHRRLGRQPEADRRGQVRGRLLDGRRGVGGLQRHRQVQGQQGQRADADGALSEQDARRHRRRHRHHEALPTSRASACRPARPAAASRSWRCACSRRSGIDPKKDIKQERLGAAESVNAIKDRKIDAFFWVGGVPTAAVTDLAATPGIKMKLIDHAEAVDAMNKKYGPLYVEGHHRGRLVRGAGQAEREHRRLEHPRHQRQDERRRWPTRS